MRKAVNRENVFIATDDERIKDVCKKYSMNCQMTSSKWKQGQTECMTFQKNIF